MPKHFHDTKASSMALAAATALSVATPVYAAASLRAISQASVTATTLPADADHNVQQDASVASLPLMVSSQSVRAAGNANANASAVAGYGLLGVVVNNGVNNALFPPAGGASQANGNSWAYASFQDVLTFNAPGLTGQRGTLFVPWTSASIGASSGLASAQPSMTSSAGVTWQLGLGVSTLAYPTTTLTSISAFGESQSYQLDTTIVTSTSHRLASDLTVLVQDSYSTTSGLVPALWSEISILFGVPLAISASMQAEALSRASNFGIATNDPPTSKPAAPRPGSTWAAWCAGAALPRCSTSGASR